MKLYSLKTVFLLILLLIIAFAGCATYERPELRHGRYLSQITVYLGVPDKAFSSASFRLTGLSVIGEDGSEIRLLDSPVTVYSDTLKGTNKVIAEGPVPDGKYSAVRLYIEGPSVLRMGKEVPLHIPDGTVEIPSETTIRKSSNVTFFLTWDADTSTAEPPSFEPSFSVVREKPDLSSLALYVTNEGSDNVSVINRQTGEVVASIMVGKRPRGIAISQGSAHRRIFVANSGSGSISVIYPETNEVVREIPVRLGKTPVGIAVASAGLLREAIFVTAYDSGSVLIIDATTYQEIDRVEVGQGPVDIVVDPQETTVHSGLLSAEETAFLESYRTSYFNVYVANYNSNSVSVLRIDNITMKCVNVQEISVDWRPVALALDYPRGRLYVANYGSNRLSVIDVVKVSGGTVSGAVKWLEGVGRHVVDVISDPVSERLYLLLEFPGSVRILRRPSVSFDNISSVNPVKMGHILTGTKPHAFTLDPESSRLYVVNKGSNSVSVIDKTSRRKVMDIPVGQEPDSIVTFPEPF